MPERVLIVGKAANNRKTSQYLKNHGYEVMRVEGLRPSLVAVEEFRPQLLLVDLVDTSYNNVHRITHMADSRLGYPFTILISDQSDQFITDVSCDLHLVRPFTSRHMEQHVRSLLDSRRSYVVSLGPLTLDRRTRIVRTMHDPVRLTPKLFQLLSCLIAHAGEVVTRRQIMQEVWHTDYVGDTRTLDVHMRWLREQIEADANSPKIIRTIRNKGYQLDIDGPAESGGEPMVEPGLVEPVAAG